jgi:hypothetical protein
MWQIPKWRQALRGLPKVMCRSIGGRLILAPVYLFYTVVIATVFNEPHEVGVLRGNCPSLIIRFGSFELWPNNLIIELSPVFSNTV